MLNRLAAFAILGAFIAGISGCNTVAGAGKDIKAGGQAIESAADKAKPK